MRYTCYECDKKGVVIELAEEIDKRFIAKDGRCLCDKCSEGVEEATERHIELIRKYKEA